MRREPVRSARRFVEADAGGEDFLAEVALAVAIEDPGGGVGVVGGGAVSMIPHHPCKTDRNS